MGQLDFYGLQAVMAREIFEAGEIFVRYRLRPPSDNLYIPLQLQLLEGEQLPIFLNIVQMENGHALRSGIEFDQQGRRVAYRFYREHPGESMYYQDAYVYVRIPADEIRHVSSAPVTPRRLAYAAAFTARAPLIWCGKPCRKFGSQRLVP
jgi:capsid protein